MKHLTFSERQYFVRHFPEVRLSSIGGLVGMGAQNVVRAYEMHGAATPMVIKYPRARTRSDFFSMVISPIFTQSPREMSEHVALCLKYFGDLVVTTEMVADIKGRNFYMIQERLSMKVLTPDLLEKHPELKPQLAEVLRRNRSLMNDTGLWFDFMGWVGSRIMRDEAYIANLAAVDTPHDGKKLKMFDLSLYLLPRPGSPYSWLHGVIHAVQNRNLRRFGFEF